MIMMIKRKTTVFAFEFSLLMSTGEEEKYGIVVRMGLKASHITEKSKSHVLG